MPIKQRQKRRRRRRGGTRSRRYLYMKSWWVAFQWAFGPPCCHQLLKHVVSLSHHPPLMLRKEKRKKNRPFPKLTSSLERTPHKTFGRKTTKRLLDCFKATSKVSKTSKKEGLKKKTSSLCLWQTLQKYEPVWKKQCCLGYYRGVDGGGASAALIGWKITSLLAQKEA